MGEKEEKKEGIECTVYLNGRAIGRHPDGAQLAQRIIAARRAGELPNEVNIEWYPQRKELYVYCDGGRVRRPLLVVEGGALKLSKEQLEGVERGELEWADLVASGAIEYLDAGEEDTMALIAPSPADLAAYAAHAHAEGEGARPPTHCELDGVGALGVIAAQLPFQEYNMSSRVLMACAMHKQSIGVYQASWQNRFDTRAYILHYPQIPLVGTRPARLLGLERRAGGQNMVIAIMSYEGFNMLDGLILNRSAVDRGLGRLTMYRTYETEERRYPGGQKDRFEIPAPGVAGYRGEELYRYLDSDGIIVPEVVVKGKDVLIGKTAPPRFLEEVTAFGIAEEKKRDASVVLKAEEVGKVDKVLITQTTAGTKIVKIRIRDTKVPENGDKYASRHGQKGVIGLIVPQEDMPFTKDGITPDIIINPHALPSRMTIGHLLETLWGKAAALSGDLVDGTTFSGQKEAEAREVLKGYGFHPAGHEVLYDGRTGQRLRCEIFVGVCYYQRLHHLVANKLHARSRGPVQLLTHQPTEGKVREGGLRFGEMERDCLIGYGASALLKERLLDESDRSIVLVCARCGALGYRDYTKNRDVCPMCEGSSLVPVEMSYAFKLLLEEIYALGIFPKIELADKTER